MSWGDTLKQENSKVCAYCELPGSMTREHVFPKWLYEETPHLDSQFLRRSRKFTAGEIQIKDVCESCNNGTLSDLDAYAKGLYRRYWRSIVRPGDSVQFEYEFDLLARWLLKVTFNSARMYQQETDHAMRLSEYAPYILGRAPRPAGLRLLVQLVVPYVVQPHESHLVSPGTTEIPPSDTRIGRPIQLFTDLTGAVCRLISLNSYYFYILLPTSTKRMIGPAVRLVQRQWDNVVCLQADEGTRLLLPSNLNALDAVQHNVQTYWKEFNQQFRK